MPDMKTRLLAERSSAQRVYRGILELWDESSKRHAKVDKLLEDATATYLRSIDNYNKYLAYGVNGKK